MYHLDTHMPLLSCRGLFHAAMWKKQKGEEGGSMVFVGLLLSGLPGPFASLQPLILAFPYLKPHTPCTGHKL
jgi:hypothetical protein